MLGLIMAGLGLASSIAGAITGNNEAKKMEELAKQGSDNKYPALMVAQSQMELNSNPLKSAQNRAIQTNIANQYNIAKKETTDPATLLGLANAYSAQGQDAMFKDDQLNYQMRIQKLQDYYNSLNAASEAKQTEFNSKANLMNAAGQTRVSAFQNIGNSLIGAGTAVMGYQSQQQSNAIAAKNNALAQQRYEYNSSHGFAS